MPNNVSFVDPGPDRPEKTNYKHQISNNIKSQFFDLQQAQPSGILNLGHCYLFGICVLLFDLFITET
jgi:hypothetical protein